MATKGKIIQHNTFLKAHAAKGFHMAPTTPGALPGIGPVLVKKNVPESGGVPFPTPEAEAFADHFSGMSKSSVLAEPLTMEMLEKAAQNLSMQSYVTGNSVSQDDVAKLANDVSIAHVAGKTLALDAGPGPLFKTMMDLTRSIAAVVHVVTVRTPHTPECEVALLNPTEMPKCSCGMTVIRDAALSLAKAAADLYAGSVPKTPAEPMVDF